MLEQAQDLLEKGDLTNAEIVLRRAIELDPQSPEVWALLAYALQQRGKLSDALDAAQSALNLDRKSWLGTIVRGLVLDSLGARDQASEAFASAVAIAPHDRQSWKLHIGTTIARQGINAAEVLVEATASQTSLPREVLDEIIGETARWDAGSPALPIDLPLRIDFLFQLPEVWASYESVWRACVEDPRIQERLVLLPFIHADARQSERAREFLKLSNLPHTDYRDIDWDQSPPHVAFIQNPYDSTRPESFATKNLVRRGIRIAYIPYAIELAANPTDCKLQYDLPLQRQAWRVYCRSHQNREMYGVHCATGNSHVVVTGHPKLDRIANLSTFEPDEALVNFIAGRKSVLWTPHFTVERHGLSTFELYADVIFEKFERHPETVLVFRPHPLLFGRMRKLGLLTEEQERDLRNRISSTPNVILDERPDYLHSFFVADALMADCGSFLLEFLPTERPILFLTKAESPTLNERGMLERYHAARSPDDIELFIDYVKLGEDPWRTTRMAQQPISLGGIDGAAGWRIKEDILRSLLPPNAYESTR